MIYDVIHCIINFPVRNIKDDVNNKPGNLGCQLSVDGNAAARSTGSQRRRFLMSVVFSSLQSPVEVFPLHIYKVPGYVELDDRHVQKYFQRLWKERSNRGRVVRPACSHNRELLN